MKRDARALPAGTMLRGRYIVGDVLGAGGFGVTYVAYDKLRQEYLAVKEYFPIEWVRRVSSGNQVVPGSQTKARIYEHGQKVFIDEAKILSKLKNIAGIVNVKDFFAENGTAYMAMELLDGYTLSKYLRHRKLRQLPWQEAGRIIREAGIALGQVHEKMLLHRDVGPDNIMITKNGDVRLIDFGSARMYAFNHANSMSVLVKPGFAPIEQYSRKGKQGPWTDVYALAATYYFLTSGIKPPEAPSRTAGVKIVPLKESVPEIPERISGAVMHALAESWKERPVSVQEFMAEMGMVRKACIKMLSGNENRHYYFRQDYTIRIGRTAEKNDVVLADRQVSALHCVIWYDSVNNRFTVRNYSSNGTYTSRGRLLKNQEICLLAGDWFFIQTAYERYIFYLEVK